MLPYNRKNVRGIAMYGKENATKKIALDKIIEKKQ